MARAVSRGVSAGGRHMGKFPGKPDLGPKTLPEDDCVDSRSSVAAQRLIHKESIASHDAERRFTEAAREIGRLIGVGKIAGDTLLLLQAECKGGDLCVRSLSKKFNLGDLSPKLDFSDLDEAIDNQ